MSFRITATETRRRLSNLTTADIADAVLEDLAFIEAAESEINVMLSDSGLTYSSLSADKQVLVKAAEIALTCQKIVTNAPEDQFKTGALDLKPASGSDKQKIADQLEKEWKRLLTLAGVYLVDIYTGYSTGDDMTPDQEDLTNIMFHDTDEMDISTSD